MTAAPAEAFTPGCNSHACQERVKAKTLVKAHAAEMRRYRADPLPWCTWGPESGAHRPEWALARYRQPNVSGGTGGGKFQFLTSTWHSVGGVGEPYDALPRIQERLARVLRRMMGLSPWVNC